MTTCQYTHRNGRLCIHPAKPVDEKDVKADAKAVPNCQLHEGKGLGHKKCTGCRRFTVGERCSTCRAGEYKREYKKRQRELRAEQRAKPEPTKT